MKRLFVPLFLSPLLFALPASATTISWGVELSGATFSDGSLIPTGFTFELGTFASGFAPGAENTWLWRENFRTSGVGERGILTWQNQDSPLFPTFGEAYGSTVFRGDGDIQEGDRVYLWGYNSLANVPSSEWILLTNETWRFPAGTPVGETPEGQVEFLATAAGTLLVFGGNFDFPAEGDNPLGRAWQTASVPEPSTYGIVLGGALAVLCGIRRRRSRRCP